MKKLLFLFLFALPIMALHAQIKLDFQGDGLNSKLKLQVYEGGTCADANMEGVEGQSSVDLNIGLAIGSTDLFLTGIGKILLDDFSIDPSDIINVTPQFNCSYHILNVRGQINSYLINNNYNSVLSKSISGDISYDDELQVYSPVATVMELPFEASASLVAAQTFCNTENSKAVATAQVTVSCGAQSATAGGKAEISGAFLDTNNPNEKNAVKVNVPAGWSTFPLRIKGSLSTLSKAQGLSPLNVIMCGSNAVASAGNSITVKYFTGPNGGALPAGMKIRGLITGVNYIDPMQANTCPNFPTPEINVSDASCGNANGSATMLVSGINQPSVEWDNGQVGFAATGFSAGLHFVVVKDSSGCSVSYPFTINDQYIPGVLLPSDVNLITGQTVVLNAVDTTGGQYNYNWSTGAQTPSISVTSPGLYTVTLTNSIGCTFIYNALVLDKPGYYISDGNIVADYGLFYDDGGANNNYSESQSNVITVCPASPSKFAVIEFIEVDILTTDDQDELSVFDGLGSICPLSNSVTAPTVFTASASSGGCLTVRFRATDYDGEGKGWKAYIKTTDTPPDGCFKVVETCSGVFEDSGGATNPYGANEYRVYSICPPKSTVGPQQYITLDFDDVQIGAGDHLAVYDGNGITCILEDSLSSPQKFIASTQSGGCLTVVFDSDNLLSKNGWHANISCQSSAINPPEYCKCGVNPIPANTCDDAPYFNNLEAYCGESSIYYTANVNGNLEAAFNCGVVHNNSFLKFIPNSSSIKLAYKAKGGTHKLCQGFQLAVFRVNGDCTASNANWVQIKCLNIDNGLSSEGIFEVTGLVPGQNYYLMIDGSYGSECYYSLTPVTGFAACPLNIGYGSVVCSQDGSFWVTIPITGKANGVTYRVYEKNNYYGEIKDTVFIDNGVMNFVSLGPYKAGRNYDIIIEGGKDLDSCHLEVSGIGDCPINCDMDVQISSTCMDQSGEIIFSGEILNAISPISIVSDVYKDVLFPNNGNTFTFKINGNVTPTSIPIFVTDFNMCSIERKLAIPKCLNCSKSFELYPNPSHDFLYYTPFECVLTTPTIFDINGRLLGVSDFKYDSLKGAFSINVSDYPAGIYFLRLNDGKTSVTRKFAKF
jgi:Secretion system C-terminal sorting domain